MDPRPRESSQAPKPEPPGPAIGVILARCSWQDVPGMPGGRTPDFESNVEADALASALRDYTEGIYHKTTQLRLQIHPSERVGGRWQTRVQAHGTRGVAYGCPIFNADGQFVAIQMPNSMGGKTYLLEELAPAK